MVVIRDIDSSLRHNTTRPLTHLHTIQSLTHFLLQMLDQNVAPDSHSYHRLLRLCRRDQNWETALEVLGYMNNGRPAVYAPSTSDSASAALEDDGGEQREGAERYTWTDLVKACSS